MLHIHSGDWSAKAASTIFGGTHLAWTDNLFEGPLPNTGWNDPAWLDARAAALSDYLGGRDRAASLLAKRYDLIRKALDRGEDLTLWFDSCLYDMMLLCQFLQFTQDWLKNIQVCLICEEIRGDGSRFAGYAELTEEELKTMPARSRPVTAAMMDEACEAWRAFTSPSPEDWLALAGKRHQLTPFLAPAARRLLEQLPDANGSNRIEAEILTALDSGCTKIKPLFEMVAAAEDRPFFGDSVVWKTLNRLASVSVPLVTIHGPAPLIPVNVYPLPGLEDFDVRQWQVTLTAEGRRALVGNGNAGNTQVGERWVANVKLYSGYGIFYDRNRNRLNIG